MQYEPTIAELRRKYEAVVRERSLLALQRDRLAAAVNGQVFFTSGMRFTLCISPCCWAGSGTGNSRCFSPEGVHAKCSAVLSRWQCGGYVDHDMLPCWPCLGYMPSSSAVTSAAAHEQDTACAVAAERAGQQRMILGLSICTGRARTGAWWRIRGAI